jgi:hypothetical protein
VNRPWVVLPKKHMQHTAEQGGFDVHLLCGSVVVRVLVRAGTHWHGSERLPTLH